MNILGISAFYHDSAAALVQDGVVTAAAQEERFTRKKHDPGFPSRAIEYCVHSQGIRFEDIDFVVFYDKPFLKFERLLETYLAFVPRGFSSFRKAITVWLKEKLFQKTNLIRALESFDENVPWLDRFRFSEHHLSHAASAFYPSPFEEAAILTMDGVGEWATTSTGFGQGKHLRLGQEIHFPHSLGLLYSAFTYYTGFKVNSGEYKLMGLAPYGKPRFQKVILDHLIDLKEDGSFRLNIGFFDYCSGLRMINRKFECLFGQPARKPEERITPFHVDIAASIQAVTEEIVIRIARNLAATTGSQNLCLAGGVALNCVANGKLVKDGAFRNIWVQPAAGDAGGALGAALAYYHLGQNKDRMISSQRDAMSGAFLGPHFTQDEVVSALRKVGAKFEVLADSDLVAKTSTALREGKAVGWMQDRMEFGPRALGNRSILGDPRQPNMQKTLNLRIKYRESFRPFAPAVLQDDVSDWFDYKGESPYMLMVAPVKEDRRKAESQSESELFGIERLNVLRSEIPAVTHVDYSARLQTVDKVRNKKFYDLLSQFKADTGCPVLVNTSFNVRGEPIVCTPEDAFRCFMGTEIEVLVVENCYLEKAKQNPNLMQKYENRFELD